MFGERPTNPSDTRAGNMDAEPVYPDLRGHDDPLSTFKATESPAEWRKSQASSGTYTPESIPGNASDSRTGDINAEEKHPDLRAWKNVPNEPESNPQRATWRQKVSGIIDQIQAISKPEKSKEHTEFAGEAEKKWYEAYKAYYKKHNAAERLNERALVGDESADLQKLMHAAQQERLMHANETIKSAEERFNLWAVKKISHEQRWVRIPLITEARNIERISCGTTVVSPAQLY